MNPEHVEQPNALDDLQQLISALREKKFTEEQIVTHFRLLANIINLATIKSLAEERGRNLTELDSEDDKQQFLTEVGPDRFEATRALVAKERIAAYMKTITE